MNLYENMRAGRSATKSCSNKLVVRELITIKRARFLQNNQVNCDNALYAWQVTKGYVRAPMTAEEELELCHREIEKINNLVERLIGL